MARKKKHEEHENHERWLVSYADFITLLFAFFVVMYSMSSVNEGKYRVLAESINAAFRSSARSMQPIQVGELARTPRTPAQSMDVPMQVNFTPIVIDGVKFQDKPVSSETPSMKVDEDEWAMDAAAEQVNFIADDVENALADMMKEGIVSLHRDRLTLEIEVKSQVLFGSASAEPSPQAETLLKEIASRLENYPNRVHVEGFADNRPIESPLYPSNWELSAARAGAVVRLFADYGISPNRMASVGYGEFRPIASNDTAEGRAANRRVVIVVLANLRDVEEDGTHSDLTLLRERYDEGGVDF